MSAECSTCGSDLDYYLKCGRCEQRERAEKAEADLKAMHDRAAKAEGKLVGLQRENERLREALRAIELGDASPRGCDCAAIARQALESKSSPDDSEA